MNEYLERLYFNPSLPGALTGPEQLYQAVKKEGKFKIGRNRIKRWLKNREEYSLQRDIKRKFPRRKIVVSGVDVEWGVDLASVENIAEFNDKVKFLLFAVDVFSRYLHIEPLKSKQAKEVVNGFDKILKAGHNVETVYSDKGAEFNNLLFKKYLRSKHIIYFTTQNEETKVAITERTIRNIRNRLFRLFRHTRSYRFLDSLQSIVKSYNSTPHSSLGTQLSPDQVTKNNEAEIWDKLYLKPNSASHVSRTKKRAGTLRFKCKVGDIVRLSYARYTFQRDYQQKWTSELFKISERYFKQDLPIYKVVDFLDDEVIGTFYEQEIQKVDKLGPEAVWVIEKVIKKRRKAGKVEYLVKWEGWPDKFNSFVNESAIKNISR